MTRLVLIVALCLLVSQSAECGFYDGNKLYTHLRDCEKSENGDKSDDYYLYVGKAYGTT